MLSQKKKLMSSKFYTFQQYSQDNKPLVHKEGIFGYAVSIEATSHIEMQGIAEKLGIILFDDEGDQLNMWSRTQDCDDPKNDLGLMSGGQNCPLYVHYLNGKVGKYWLFENPEYAKSLADSSKQ